MERKQVKKDLDPRKPADTSDPNTRRTDPQKRTRRSRHHVPNRRKLRSRSRDSLSESQKRRKLSTSSSHDSEDGHGRKTSPDREMVCSNGFKSVSPQLIGKKCFCTRWKRKTFLVSCSIHLQEYILYIYIIYPH